MNSFILCLLLWRQPTRHKYIITTADVFCTQHEMYLNNGTIFENELNFNILIAGGVEKVHGVITGESKIKNMILKINYLVEYPCKYKCVDSYYWKSIYFIFFFFL